MAPPQRFYPTSWRFHPSGGSTAQLFNQGAHPARTACAGVWERPPGVWPGGRSGWGVGPGPRNGPRGGDAVPPGRSSAAPCQLPPPHPPPPPPQDDPPPQDEPPPQDWPEWCPSEDEPPPSPAHQLLPPPSPPPPLRRDPLPPLVRTGPEPRRPITKPLISKAATTNRMMPVSMAPPSFRPGPEPGDSPEAIPRRTPRRVSVACGSRREALRREREMPLAATPQSRVEEVQSFGAG